jgi:hypothetical protein
MTVYRLVHSAELTTTRIGRGFRIHADSVRRMLSVYIVPRAQEGPPGLLCGSASLVPWVRGTQPQPARLEVVVMPVCDPNEHDWRETTVTKNGRSMPGVICRKCGLVETSS